jgi:hypothetical protein
LTLILKSAQASCDLLFILEGIKIPSINNIA